MKQHTLADSITLEGKGLHTGRIVRMTIKPAPANSGVVFHRTDMSGDDATIPALAEYVAATERGTVLKKGACTISTVEHCLSALYAFGIDNCTIELNGPEVPILDGSAKYFVQNIKHAGICDQDAECREWVVDREITFDRGISHIRISPCDHYELNVHIAFDSPVLSSQDATLDSIDKYSTEIAECRTFVFIREIETLLAAGLIKGGDLANALVIYDHETSPENLQKLAESKGETIHKIDSFGYINGPLKFDNEPARHKLLDLMGDLSLVGEHIRGRIDAECPGHGVNSACAKMIREKYITK